MHDCALKIVVSPNVTYEPGCLSTLHTFPTIRPYLVEPQLRAGRA